MVYNPHNKGYIMVVDTKIIMFCNPCAEKSIKVKMWHELNINKFFVHPLYNVDDYITVAELYF